MDPEDRMEAAFEEWNHAADNLNRIRAEYQDAVRQRKSEREFIVFKLGGAVTEHYQAMREAMDRAADWLSKGE